MPGIIRKLLYIRNLLNRRKPDPDEIIEEKWIANFSSPKNARFNIKSESSYDASLQKNLFSPGGEPLPLRGPAASSGHSLALSLKKTRCIAWVEAPDHRYRDIFISGVIRIDARGGYGAGGLFFRMVDSGTYYSFLISSKGYFRLDAIRNSMPFPLIGWTELPLSQGAAPGPNKTVDFSIIAYGSHIVILIRGRWAAEISDSSILEGTVCFAAASYETGDPSYKVIREEKNAEDVLYTAGAFLESLTVDSRIAEVSAAYEKWRDSPDIDPKARLCLAETFAAMNQYNAAMVQLRKSWDMPGRKKNQRELLLAGRLAQALGLMAEAEGYISKCFQTDVESPEGKEAVVEMAKILYAGERFTELKEYCAEAVKIKNDDPDLWTFQGHACWNLREYKNASAAYDRAFELDGKNGIYAKNAANVYDVMEHKKEALDRYLKAGRAFLQTSNHNDLGLLVPKLLSLGKDNWEAHGLAGKWAFAVEDWKMMEDEFKKSEELRKAKRPKPRKDGAQIFLKALLLIRAGKRRDALPLLEEAAALEKNYALFRFRLAENLFLLNGDPDDAVMLEEMNTALALLEKDAAGEKIPAGKEDDGLAGWVNNFAAQVALQKGNLDAAAGYLENAVKVLGGLPAVKVNQAVLFYLRGAVDKALGLLDVEKQDDPEGIMANCAGNLLVRSNRFEEADEKYRKALAAAPDNVEYLCNRASCLMELRLFGEADELLSRACAIAPGPAILEMISFVAAKKGEYPRAEQACRSALEIDPCHAPSLLSLGWILLTLGRQKEAGKTLERLEKLELKEDAAKGREELRARLDELSHRTITCASCGNVWKLPKDQPPVPAMRIFAMPPDNLPAGSCVNCGKTYCIGCAKKNLDPNGRFICPSCDRPLKLVDDGLKKLIYDWAVAEGLLKTKNVNAGSEKKQGRAGPAQKGVRAKKEQNILAPETQSKTGTPGRAGKASGKTSEAPPALKRGRGRPRKS